jgi:anaerobic ribonucleoside-triphosphate reductase activating protein
MDITNGNGVGVSLFTQGCSHHCKGCFNSETWDFNGGYELTEDIKNKFLESCKTADFVSILGGEPFDQTRDLEPILAEIRALTDKPIYLWSGYTYDQIEANTERRECLKYITYLIDGEFIEELKDMKLKLRGSSNQRIINVQRSLREGRICLAENLLTN